MTEAANVTISAPLGTSQHDRQGFLCVPAKWSTVLAFFVANYLIHAFTLWRKPGETTLEYVFTAILALLFPMSAIGRGLDAIYRHASWQACRSLLPGLLGFGGAEYEKRAAARAGALAILVREHVDRLTLENSSGKPYFEYNADNWDTATLTGKLLGQNDNRRNMTLTPTCKIAMDVEKDEENSDCLRHTRNISGLFRLHDFPSYIVKELTAHDARTIKIEQSSAKVSAASEPKFNVAQSSSIPQIILAIIQIAYASYTLAKNTGDEVERNGYASFNLTVIPYIFMSFINLIGNLATPSYPCIYLVETSTMLEAQDRGNIITGCIACIPDKHLKTVAGSEDFRVSRASCNTRLIQENPPSSRSRRSESTKNLRRINVCFDKKCQQRSSHASVTVGTGKLPPFRSLRSRLFELVLMYVIGLGCIVALPITILYYVYKHYPVQVPLQDGLPVVLWYIVGDLMGLFLIKYRKSINFSRIFGDIRIIFMLLFMCCSIGKGYKMTYRKRKAYMSGRWLKVASFAFVFLVGFAAAVWNFYHVAVQLLRFGSCRSLDD